MIIIINPRNSKLLKSKVPFLFSFKLLFVRFSIYFLTISTFWLSHHFYRKCRDGRAEWLYSGNAGRTCAGVIYIVVVIIKNVLALRDESRDWWCRSCWSLLLSRLISRLFRCCTVHPPPASTFSPLTHGNTWNWIPDAASTGQTGSPDKVPATSFSHLFLL